MSLVAIDRALSRRLASLHFGPPVTHVYDPLRYARRPHEVYLERYGVGPREVVLLGMNPGPFGMGQTGVPFGDVGMVRDWLGIEAPVGRPAHEHPKRPVQGFSCARSEVSGSRLWGWARDRFGTPEAFFARFFVINYCPLLFMEESGRNRTPDKLPSVERSPLLAACDDALGKALRELSPSWVVGVGAWATSRAQAVAPELGLRVGTVLHPSPASPRANRGWAHQAEEDFRKLGIVL